MILAGPGVELRYFEQRQHLSNNLNSIPPKHTGSLIEDFSLLCAQHHICIESKVPGASFELRNDLNEVRVLLEKGSKPEGDVGGVHDALRGAHCPLQSCSLGSPGKALGLNKVPNLSGKPLLTYVNPPKTN